MKTTKILATAALAIAATGAQAALVNNGSFEVPIVTNPNNWDIYYPSIPGWTGGAYGIEIQRNGTLPGVSAFDGKQYVELDTTKNSSMSQSLTTTANSIYKLNFAYMGRPNNPFASPSNTTSNTIEILWNGNIVGTLSSIGPVWLNTTYNLTATGSNSLLEFRAAGASDGYGGLIDAVSVTAVPEPETYALLLAGLGLMGTIARRRNKSRAD